MDLNFHLNGLEADSDTLQPQINLDCTVSTNGRSSHKNATVEAEGHIEVDGERRVLPPLMTPSGGLGGLNANDTPITLRVPLPHRVLEEIEEFRQGKQFTIVLKAVFTADSSNNNNDQRVKSSETVSRTIYADEWSSRLDDLGFHDRRVVDLRLGGNVETRDLLHTAQAQVERAQRQFDSGDYKSAMTACRDAIESLRHVDEERLEETVGEQKWERFDAQMGVFEKRFLGLLSHSSDKTSSKPPLRRDAEFGIIQTKSFIRYFSVALQEESQQREEGNLPENAVRVDLDSNK